jgi:hypothetical protein
VPELANDLAGAGEPFLVAPELLQGFSRVVFDAITHGVAKRFEQPRAGENGNVMGFESQKPGGFKHVEPRRENLPVQEFNLLFVNVHKVILQGGDAVRFIGYTQTGGRMVSPNKFVTLGIHTLIVVLERERIALVGVCTSAFCPVISSSATA